MSRKQFTEGEQQLLRQNPYIFSVTKTRITLTKEFKEIFINACKDGKIPRKILEEHGFDLNIPGKRRIWSISCHIKDEYRKYGEFHNGYRLRATSIASSDENLNAKITNEAAEIRQLRHEVDYLKQEMEFKKKLPQSELQGSRCAAHERIFLYF